MSSDQSNLFELEENELEFHEVCCKLKSHEFTSPWEMFFNSPSTNDSITDVSEFIINEDNDNAMETDCINSSDLIVASTEFKTNNRSEKNHITCNDEIIDQVR